LAQVQFVVDQHGQTTGVFLPIEIWQILLAWLEKLEDDEDRQLLTERLPKGRLSETPEMLRWDEVRTELINNDFKHFPTVSQPTPRPTQ
jgi:hypothetical protein